jgi:hypothetical protein
MRTFNIREEGYYRLQGFLIDRENDIALDIEDFGELREIFKIIIGKDAQPLIVPAKEADKK